MGHNGTQNQMPNLLSAKGTGDQLPDAGSDKTPIPSPPKTILPKDLTKAIGYLDDQALDRLLGAAIEEVKRRGRLPLGFEASSANATSGSAEPSAKPGTPAGSPSRRRQGQIVSPPLTRGQINAVRATFKAGIIPPRIARQFGLTQANVRKALASDETK